MIGDAVVAAEHCGSDQAKQLLCFGPKRAGFVGLMVEREEALHAQVATAKNFFVQVSAKFLKVFQAIGHGSSREPLAAKEIRRAGYYE